MIQFSTLSSGLYPADDFPSETLETLGANDLSFYTKLKEYLDKELKDPSPESINFIKAYSLSKKS
ncbi:hypothetical protein B0I27_102401 [Arcticibacter pallidicorallinus]|uniref:Uncharacterized protein n=1 Tax=Arcticibacter pallidicorallinus TaxID=1259464 RepID=A0A2T0U9L2_9SPHI|nr:hypothetical protein [Arcticibacter pallidicorallinus]PRY54631.1 hypothetical protein B0I27_102401 [Arcticibacter pallidicorallinus]